VSFVVVTRHRGDVEEQARAALGVLAARPGYVRGRLLRAAEDPTVWLLLTEWENLGSWRRALSGHEVKMVATPLLATAAEEVSGFDVVADV
jgi:heme-degrading monooxygenase HmoA